uniref:TRPM SLOG domain-containing protein n=1 Tax=Gadus morhua TaxID=8049 RepID=A0A8C5FIA5_GADMO
MLPISHPKADDVLQLMLSEWQMDRPKLLISVQGGSENLILPPKVSRAFSKGLLTAALSTGAWILTDGINTGVSKYVGEAQKKFGSHNLRKRNTVGVTPWGMINNNNNDLIGRDVSLKPICWTTSAAILPCLCLCSRDRAKPQTCLPSCTSRPLWIGIRMGYLF